MIETYVKRPLTIEALQWTGNNDDEIFVFTGTMPDPGYAVIETPEGTMHLSPGDWIIKDIAGEFYPCKDHIFQRTYSKVRPGLIPRDTAIEALTAYLEREQSMSITEDFDGFDGIDAEAISRPTIAKIVDIVLNAFTCGAQ